MSLLENTIPKPPEAHNRAAWIVWDGIVCNQPEIENMTFDELRTEEAVCRYFEGHATERALRIGGINTSVDRTQAMAWGHRLRRVIELQAQRHAEVA